MANGGMFAQLPEWVNDWGIVIVGLASLSIVVTWATKARWVRWLWRQVISDPVTRWLTATIRAVVDPVANHTADLAGQLVAHMGAEERLRADDAADRDRRQAEMDLWRDEIRADVAESRDSIVSIQTTMATKADVRTVHRRIDTALSRLALGNPELRPIPPLRIPTPPEFDSATAPEWSQMAAELDVSGEVIVDMASTTLCDSAGIGAMVHLAQRTAVAGGAFSVENVSPMTARSVRILGLGSVLGLD